MSKVRLIISCLCFSAAIMVLGALMVASQPESNSSFIFGPSEDGFADNLSIPENVEAAEPQSQLDAEPGALEDSFQQSLLTALDSHGNDDSTITGTVSALAKLQQNAPGILKRYLAASPSWRVFKEDGNVFAIRRWMIGSKWQYSSAGYYTLNHIDPWSEAGIPDFQFRFTIGLSGKSIWRGNDSTRLHEGDKAKVTLSVGNRMHESNIVITAGALVVEVFEQSDVKERRLTKAALDHLEKELTPLVEQPTLETIRGILPAGSISKGEASLELRNYFQPGIYDIVIRVNPGEPGMLYLKAFEVTQGMPLSSDSLKEKSNEWTGWSNNPDELFFSNTRITIYEGDWGKPYAARFEVWLAPDSGSAERKLREKIFKIEGWQR